MVHTDMADIGMSNRFGAHAAVTIRAVADPNDSLGDQRFYLAEATDNGDLLFVAARFGEHAQIEHGSCSVFVLDDHERVVENVGHLVVVALVEMIHILRTTCHDANGLVVDEEVHEVEEVTALLNKRSAGIAIESVPVADLHQERESVLTDSDHLHLANSSGSNFGQHSLGRGHEPVLESHPDDATGAVGGLGSFDCVVAVFDSGTQWLLDQCVHTAIEHIEQDFVMGVIW